MFPRFCICVSHRRWYTKGAVGFDGSVSTAIAGNLHTDHRAKGWPFENYSVSHFPRYSQGKSTDASVYMLGSCRRCFVGYIGEKTISLPLCIAIASGGLQNRHIEIQTCSTLSPFRGYNVEKYPFVPLVGSLSLTIAYETDSFRRFCIRVLSVCSYRNRAVRFDSSISTAIAWTLHTNPSGKGGTLWKILCIAFSSI